MKQIRIKVKSSNTVDALVTRLNQDRLRTVARACGRLFEQLQVYVQR